MWQVICQHSLTAGHLPIYRVSKKISKNSYAYVHSFHKFIIKLLHADNYKGSCGKDWKSKNCWYDLIDADIISFL